MEHGWLVGEEGVDGRLPGWGDGDRMDRDLRAKAV